MGFIFLQQRQTVVLRERMTKKRDLDATDILQPRWQTITPINPDKGSTDLIHSFLPFTIKALNLDIEEMCPLHREIGKRP